MSDLYNFQGVDLRTATIYDIAEILPEYPAIIIDSETELSNDDERIFSLITYAESYEITDLEEKLNELYKEELLSILQ